MTDRPVECSHCKKNIKVIYKEIVGNSMISSEMCADCPILQERLHGQVHPSTGHAIETDLYCDNCHTSLDALKMGNPLGCSECYSVFGDQLVTELISRDLVLPKFRKNAQNKTLSLHTGKTPFHPLTMRSSAKITTLNEALGEALKRENYEQAAWLRDQIKALQEKSDEGKD